MVNNSNMRQVTIIIFDRLTIAACYRLEAELKDNEKI